MAAIFHAGHVGRNKYIDTKKLVNGVFEEIPIDPVSVFKFPVLLYTMLTRSALCSLANFLKFLLIWDILNAGIFNRGKF